MWVSHSPGTYRFISYSWSDGTGSSMSSIRMDPYLNCLVSLRRHFVSCQFMFRDTASAQSYMVGLRQSRANCSWVLVASCCASEPTSLIIMNSKTRSVKFSTVGIYSFPLVANLCVPEHSHAINISRVSLPTRMPSMWGISPQWDKPVRKYISVTLNSMS